MKVLHRKQGERTQFRLLGTEVDRVSVMWSCIKGEETFTVDIVHTSTPGVSQESKTRLDMTREEAKQIRRQLGFLLKRDRPLSR